MTKLQALVLKQNLRRL